MVNRIVPLPISKLNIDKSVMTYLMNIGQKITCGTYIWYIEGPDENIIVDTGCDARLQTAGGFPAEQIMTSEEALRNVGLKPEDVDIVIITHLHTNHCADSHKYRNAKFIVQRREIEAALNPHPAFAYMFNKRFFADVKFEVVDGEEEIAEGVKVLLTPGHSPGGQSVLVETVSGKAVITGFCCIRENFEPPTQLRKKFRFIMPGIHIDMVDLYESMKRVSDIADIVIPLHDQEYLKVRSIP